MLLSRPSLAFIFLLFTSQPGFSAFYLDREIEYIDVDLDEVGNRFTRTITFSFMSVCNVDLFNCLGREHSYQFGLSLNNEGENNTVSLFPPPAPVLDHGELNSYVASARYTNRGADIPIVAGSWSETFELNEQQGVWYEASLNLNLKEGRLKNLAPGEYQSIYLVGRDIGFVGGEIYNLWETMEIRIRRADNRKVKISKLKDVDLTEYNNSQSRAEEMPFCIHVTDGDQYVLRANGSNDDFKNKFNLINGSERVVYKMDFSPDNSGWQADIRPGDSLYGTGSAMENCGNAFNAWLRIYLDGAPANSGTYSDTVTLTVSAV
ncbi:hypothetical protein [Endozoicomonas elysicola]|uniref:Spore coat protein U domain-containing protein n=1 Tax=Endozoicomonas elysicola TaxID=305900 RepID=A0A081K7E0_9GAMM|nr:hypothetical protein [Endozoicomonas elysicola]KEI70066.1 hypothetical protein GV64_04290 [Endozoicomonas elysicola]